MTDDKIELSRRKALAGLGTIGAASIGAGLGTSAYFSDRETFENNTLTAGSLDLKVDWEEHYSDWSADENNDRTDDSGGDESDTDRDGDDADDFQVYMDAEDIPDGVDTVGLPDPENPLLFVPQASLDDFMDNTAVEAYPDPDNDGIQEIDTGNFTYMPCEMGADTPSDLDPSGDGLRTQNADTEGAAPLVQIEDVKPGDFGELTLSFHLCDNPGYVWLQGQQVSASENGLTEPEKKDPDEEDGTVELLDQIQTAWWYDTNGNNVIDSTIGENVDVMVLLDTSGSLNSNEQATLTSAANDLISGLKDQGGDSVHVGGLKFGDNSIDVTRALGSSSFSFNTSGAGSGNTPMPAALDVADQHLDDAGRSGAEQVIVLLTDGDPNYLNQTYSADGLTAPRAANWSADDTDQAYDNAGNPDGGGGSSPPEKDETALVADNIKNATGTDTGDASRIIAVGVGNQTDTQYLKNEIASSPADFINASFDSVSEVVNDIVELVAMTEEVFHRGTLGEDLGMLASGNGIPLDGDLTTAFDEIEGSDDAEARECFNPGVNHYIGFAWWLPVDHGNEAQSDSVSFDLGFYTEQCRHNDGSGLTPEPTQTPD